LQEVESEYINLRAALSQALETGQAEAALQLSVALGNYLERQGTASEGFNLVEQALALAASSGGPAHLNKRLVAAALSWAGAFMMNLGDTALACRKIEESLALQREVGDTPGLIFSLYCLTQYAIYRGDYAKAEEYLAESLSLSLELGEEGKVDFIRNDLRGLLALYQGKYDEARSWFGENLVMGQASGNKAAMAPALCMLGVLDGSQGKYGEGQGKIEQALLLYRELKINWGIALALNSLVMVMLNQGEYAQARECSLEGLALSRRYGYGHVIAESLCSLGTVALCEHNYQEARRCLEEGLDILRKRDDVYYLAPVLPVLGLVAANQGEDEAARQYFKETLALNRKASEGGDKLYLSHALSGLAGLWLNQWLKTGQKAGWYPSNYLERVVRLSGAIRAILLSHKLVMYRYFAESYESNLKLARANMDAATFETVFREGQAMSMEEAIAYALGI
jgi:tetratricopeptide (TPR) repeat protein